jgi:rubrerythrin
MPYPMIEELTMPTTCPACARHLDEASTAEARNHIRTLHLADVADALGDAELGALLREHSTQEELHALRLFELASTMERDLVTGEPLLTSDDVIRSALLYARCQAEETSPWYATVALDAGCEDMAALFERHAEACREQVADLEALRHRRS